MRHRQRQILPRRQIPRILVLLPAVVAQPFRREGPGVEAVFEAVDYERFAADDDVEEDELFEGGQALLVDHVAADAVDVVEVVVAFDERFEVEVGGDGLEGGPWALSRHVAGCGVEYLQLRGVVDMDSYTDTPRVTAVVALSVVDPPERVLLLRRKGRASVERIDVLREDVARCR